ncbi:MAG: hypothetical protein IKS17_01865 [Firmicutes bacterium]|nr:hypothetical protein [Bacillota bacterium]
MKTLPIIKAEFRRSAWVLWPVLFALIPACIGRAANDMSNSAYYSSMYLEGELFVTGDVLETLGTFSVLWTALLVYVQYANDRPDFAKALPYTSKQLILSKASAAVFIGAVTSAVYVLFMLGILRKYSWLVKTESWTGIEQYIDVFDVNFVLISAAAAFVLAMAMYWYISLCCCVCRRVYAGLWLAFLGFLSFTGFMNLSNEIETVDPVSALGCVLEKVGLEGYTISIFVMLFALVLLLITMLPALKLYGGGNSAHPVFRYSGAAKAFYIFSGLSAALYFPYIANMRDNIPLALVIGGVIGIGLGAVLNKFILKRCGQ